jgi:hypothetical protein
MQLAKILRILIMVVAVAMMGVGGLIVLGEMFIHDKTVFQQTATRIDILAGVCLFGFGLVALAVCNRKGD